VDDDRSTIIRAYMHAVSEREQRGMHALGLGGTRGLVGKSSLGLSAYVPKCYGVFEMTEAGRS